MVLSQPIRAAVVQAAPMAFDLTETMARVERLARQASAEGADLAVFPEAFIGGYPKGADFGAQVGMRSPEGRVWYQRYCEGAITLPGPECKQLQGLAEELKLIMVMGLIEKEGNNLYCATAVIGRDGSFLGRHRKVMPTGVERLIWGFGDGSTLSTVQTTAGVVGSAICWESYMPQLRLSLYHEGVQLYCASTVDDRDSWIHTMRHIAVEGRCFVLSACQYAKRFDFPPDYSCIQGDDAGAVLIRGGSCIVDPFGNMLVEPVYNREAILYADVDIRQIAQGKFDLDVAGHYARPDLFNLRVNRKPQVVVEDEPDPW